MKKVIRAGILEIDTLKKSEYKWVSCKIQHLEIDETDGTVLSESARMSRMVRRIDKVAFETVTVFDPVTQQNITISVAGIGSAIEDVVAKWLVEDHDAYYDEELDAVVLNEPTR